MGRSSATSARSRRSASSPRTTSWICFRARSVRPATCATRDGMLVSSALAPDGSPVDGFEFEGRTVRYRGDEPVDAGIRVALDVRPTDDPQWLVPGVFYGENRPESCTRLYPRFMPGRVDLARMESDAWSFRADRCATPAVFARGGALVTTEESPLGQSGAGFPYLDGAPVLRLHFPYREEPLSYDGSERAAAADVCTYRFSPSERVELAFTTYEHDRHAEILRAAAPPAADPAWVSVSEAAALAAH